MKKTQEELKKEFLSIKSFSEYEERSAEFKELIQDDETARHALFKILYLATMDITAKWTGASWNWGQTLDQLCIYFGDRITPADME